MKEQQPVLPIDVLIKRVHYNQDIMIQLGERRRQLVEEMRRIDGQIASVQLNTIEIQGEMRRRRAL